MILQQILASALLLLASVDSKKTSPFKHTNALRTIDLTKSYIRETHALVVENIATSPQSEYLWPVDTRLEENMSSIEVKEKGADNRNYKIEKIEGSDGRFFRISLLKPLGVGEKITLHISTVYIDALVPVPAQIPQTAKQYLRWTGSKYIPSAYSTEKQKTKFKYSNRGYIIDISRLPSNDVPFYTKPSSDSQGPALSDTTLTYGPYDSISPDLQQEISVRYEFTLPVTKIFSLDRQIYVSHWRNTAKVTEQYSLINAGAKLKGFFSRYEQMQMQQAQSPVAALQVLPIGLTGGARDAWFTDEIGNVSTSQFKSMGKKALLAVRPRYPLFGGWKYAFGIGWTVDLNNVVSLVDGNRMTLKIPFIEGPINVAYDLVKVNIRLPEGCTNVQVESDVPLVAQVIEPYMSFLDTVGSTLVTLKAEKITDEMQDRDITIQLSYEFPPWAGFRKIIVGGSVFLSAIIGLFLLRMIPTKIG
ncbi:Dolichyl-diphosphooligosaccharide--protein glycosyltransferase subunit 1 [Neolecta irregularis DAH-3]|uniref:Dolichyl-diphosphooligosaccharide--protein glycosyltransferase subunit 1 n=1 Tax=Neolecta irregularis (strain DAH-3) TaxID=1198029 RepID=A0A1U7LIZ9_NEOID|nr:Dolichyl-diphosphooligosaccharide--protein glycosyltransferase subunit 1 [Neolecta irregularis DAH-3]|eukprot:OLL22627.1 Dolichyl-diphosphooligosaccharide--protein glycosyltransferase subunit 1 [Neolecta irregularis DAH-3]